MAHIQIPSQVISRDHLSSDDPNGVYYMGIYLVKDILPCRMIVRDRY